MFGGYTSEKINFEYMIKNEFEIRARSILAVITERFAVWQVSARQLVDIERYYTTD